MNKVIATGKTVEEAVNSALRQLETTEDKVNIRIIEKPGKKLFGLMGTKEAVVEVEVIETDKPIIDEVFYTEEPIDKAKTFLNNIFDAMEIPVDIDDSEESDGNTVLNLIGDDLGILIGRRGQTLDALQYLVNIVANKDSENNRKRIMLDAENYRYRRQATLEDLAEKLADRVLRTGKEVVLEPMTPLERKIIHTQLQDHPKIQTHSTGEEPNRKVVISKK